MACEIHIQILIIEIDEYGVGEIWDQVNGQIERT